jgi:hypothetical protein
MNMDLVPKKVDENSEWVVIIGSAGAVGSFAVQVKACIQLRMLVELIKLYRLPTYAATKFLQHVLQALLR